MDQRKYESISALLDGEANELEVQRLLADLDDESLDLIKRQMAVRSVMRSPDEIAFSSLDISAAVSAEINDAAVPVSIATSTTPNGDSAAAVIPTDSYWQKGFAIAACAVLSVFAVLRFDPSNRLDQSALGHTVAGLEATVPNIEQRQPVLVEQLSPADVKRFNEYLLRHAEYASYGSGQGIMPLARVASVSSVGI